MFQKLWRVSWYQSLKLDAKNPVTVILKVSLKLGVYIASNSNHSDALMWNLNDVMRRTHFPHLCRVESVTFLLIWEYSKWQLSCYCSWGSDGCSSDCVLFPLGISLKISYKIDAPVAWTIGKMASLYHGCPCVSQSGPICFKECSVLFVLPWHYFFFPRNIHVDDTWEHKRDHPVSSDIKVL